MTESATLMPIAPNTRPAAIDPPAEPDAAIHDSHPQAWPAFSDDWLRTNTFMPTVSGRIWPLLSATAQDVHWPDIARQLARLPRFAGCTDGDPYSVAQHSVAVMRLVQPCARPHALLHDAHEAFIGDMITPMKRALAIAGAHAAQTLNFPAYHGTGIVEAALQQVRNTADAAIHTRAGIAMPWQAPWPIRKAVGMADRTMLAREVQWLLPDGPAMDAWATLDPTLFAIDRGPEIEVLPPDMAEQQFLHALAETFPAIGIELEAAG